MEVFFLNIRFPFIWFHSMLIFILFKLCIFPPLFYIKVYAVRASKLSYSFC